MWRLLPSLLVLLLYFNTIKGCDQPDKFSCKDSHACIEMPWRCDGTNDCDDGSDEEGCPKTTCADSFFRCEDGQCVPDRWVCDNTPDCKDESDELPIHCQGNQNQTCSGYKCNGGRCIPSSSKCDGAEDCPEGDDEKECQIKCQDSEFQCKDSKCIDKKWRCDGHKDCDDGSDEVECTVSACEEGEFLCKDGTCINDQWICDGDGDCPDDSDEKNCTAKELIPTQTCDSTMFHCKTPLNEVQCIANAWRCDGDADCEDQSDEEGCEGTKTCSSEETMCLSDMYCVKKEFWCDGDIDCQDGSDEMNCTHVASSNCKANHFDCNGDGSKCILDQYLCDGNDDCGNFADERSCPTKNPCNEENGGCQHICVATETGRICECNAGFKLTNGTQTDCEDIDECKVRGTCSQICINRKGSYKCVCEEGYFLSDNRCKANTDIPPELIFTDNYDIRRYELATRHYKLLMDKTNLAGAVILDFDIRNSMVYWAGVTSHHTFEGFKMANLATGEVKAVQSEHVKIPDGLAVDWVHGNLYISDTGFNHIVVFKLDNTYSKVLLAENLDEPRSIVVDPYHGWMYFTDWGTDPKIEKCGMNGKERKVIVTENIVWPNGLAIDYVDNRLYWVDAKLHHISSTDLDGGDFRLVLKGHRHLGHPFAISVFEDFIYWTDWVDNGVHKMSKFGVGNVTTIASDLKRPYDVRVYHIYRQPAKINHCGANHGGCSHFCLPIPQHVISTTSIMKRSECACPDGMTLEDNYNCVNGTAVITPKPSTKPDGGDTGNPNRPQTPLVKPSTTKPAPVPEQPTTQGNPEDKTADKAAETTEKPSETTENGNGTSVKLTKTDDGGSPKVGHVAGIAVGAILGVVFIVAIVAFILVRRYRKKNVRSMNFDNPVYRKTTTDDQLIMDKDSSNSRVERESMQPLNQEAEIV